MEFELQQKERNKMAISFKPLWHLLIEKNMNKEDLKRVADISGNVVSRMGKDNYINLESIEKICVALRCTPNDVFEIKLMERE